MTRLDKKDRTGQDRIKQDLTGQKNPRTQNRTRNIGTQEL